MGAGMPALGLSAAAVLVKGLVVRCDPRLPSHPKEGKIRQKYDNSEHFGSFVSIILPLSTPLK